MNIGFYVFDVYLAFILNYYQVEIFHVTVYFILQTEKKDLIFILTERYRVAILGYKAETGDIVTMACGDVQVFLH